MAVAKAGLCASLPARTTVLAAANPAGGTYSRGKVPQRSLLIMPVLQTYSRMRGTCLASGARYM